MSSTRQVPIRVAFLRAGKTPKSYQVLLARTQYGPVSGVTPEKPSELHRHTSRTTVTLLMLDGLQSLCECSSQNTHVSLPPWPVFKEPSLPSWVTDSHYRDCLLLLGLSSLFGIFLTCCADMHLRQVHILRSLGGLGFICFIQFKCWTLQLPRNPL